MLAEHVLSLATWLPIFGGMAVLATGSDRNADYARQLSLVVAVLTFLVTLPLYTGFNSATHAMQFVEDYAWIEIETKVAQYHAAFLIMEGLMIGVFSALDGILFYIFWEAMLVPMFLS